MKFRPVFFHHRNKLNYVCSIALPCFPLHKRPDVLDYISFKSHHFIDIISCDFIERGDELVTEVVSGRRIIRAEPISLACWIFKKSSV